MSIYGAYSKKNVYIVWGIKMRKKILLKMRRFYPKNQAIIYALLIFAMAFFTGGAVLSQEEGFVDFAEPVMEDAFMDTPSIDAESAISLLIFENSVFVDGNGNKKFETDYSCGEGDDKDVISGLLTHLMSNGTPDTGLPDTAVLSNVNAAYPANLSFWGEVIVDPAEDDTTTQFLPRQYVSTAYVYTDVSCDAIEGQNFELIFSKDSEIDSANIMMSSFTANSSGANLLLRNMGSLGLGGGWSNLNNDVCTEVLKPSVSTSKFNIVYILDAGLAKIINGDAPWGGLAIPWDEIIYRLIPGYADDLFKFAFKGNKKQLGVYALKVDKDYSECEFANGKCSWSVLLNHAMQGCGLKNTQDKIRVVLLHGIDFNSKNVPLGFTYLNANVLVTNVGLFYREAVKYITKPEKRNAAKRDNLNEGVSAIIKHEFGHTTGRDHLNCNTNAPKNTADSICHDTQKGCETLTGNDCEWNVRNSGKWSVVTRGNKTPPSLFQEAAFKGYMYPTSDDRDYKAGAEYQEWGTPFIPTQMNKHFKDFLKSNRPVCGNGIAELGEDVDFGKYAHNKFPKIDPERAHVAFCSNIGKPTTEYLTDYPLGGNFRSTDHEEFMKETRKCGFFGRKTCKNIRRSLLRSNRNRGADTISINENTCRFFIPCTSKRVGNYDFQTGFKTANAQVDCAGLATGFKPGKVFTDFFDTRCDLESIYFNEEEPIFGENTNNLIVAYLRKNTSSQKQDVRIVAFDKEMNRVTPFKEFSIPYNEKVLDIEIIEGPPSYHNPWTYNSTISLNGSFNNFQHPFFTVVVTDAAIRAYSWDIKFDQGAYARRYYYLAKGNLGSKIDKVIDISHYDFEPNDFVVVTFTVEQIGKTAKPVYQYRFSTNSHLIQPTVTMINSDYKNVLTAQGQFVGVAPDSRTLYSLLGYSKEVVYTQHSPMAVSKYVRNLPLDRGRHHVGARRISDIVGSFDKLHRTIATWINEDKNGKELNVSHAVVEAYELRWPPEQKIAIPVNSQLSNYPVSLGTQITPQVSKLGKFFSVAALSLDRELAVVDPYFKGAIKLPYEPQQGTNADQRKVYSFTLIEDSGMVPYEEMYSADGISTKWAVLANRKDKTSMYPQVVLYQQNTQGSNMFKEKVIEYDATKTIEYSDLEILATAAGPDKRANGKLVCEDQTTFGFLTGNGKLLDTTKEGLFLFLKGDWRTGHSFEIYSDGNDDLVNTLDDTKVHSLALKSGVTPYGIASFYNNSDELSSSDVAFPDDIFYFITVEPKGAGQAFYGYRFNIATKGLTKTKEFPMPPTQGNNFSISYSIRGAHLQMKTMEDEIFECNFVNCTLKKITKLPESAYYLFSKDDVVMYAGKSSVYIVDDYGVHTFAQKPRFVKRLDFGLYNLLYEKNGELVRGMVTTVGGIKLIKEKSTYIALKSGEGIWGASKVKGYLDVVGIKEAVSPYKSVLRAKFPVSEGECSSVGGTALIEDLLVDPKLKGNYISVTDVSKTRVFKIDL